MWFRGGYCFYARGVGGASLVGLALMRGLVEEACTATLVTLVVYLPCALRTGMRRLLPGMRVTRRASKKTFTLRHSVGVICDSNTTRYTLLRRFFASGKYALAGSKTAIGITLIRDVTNTCSCRLCNCSGRTCTLGVATSRVLVATMAGANIVHTTRALTRLTRKCSRNDRTVNAIRVAS